MIDWIISSIRFLQGERRGMGSQLKPPTRQEELLAAALYPDLFLAPTIQIQTSVKLADVSFWQGVINFVVMKAAGLFGVIIRAGQNTWADIKFKINWALAKAAGLPRGSYFFYDSRVDPGRQAKLWADQLGDDLGELAHAADFEESYGGPFGKKEHFKAFLQEFQRLTGLPNDRIMIYTGFFWWLARVGDDPWFRRYSLWLASYGRMDQVRIPAPWTIEDFLLWQYTAEGNGTAYGVGSREIDLNYYCCDPFDYFKRFPRAVMEVPPIPPNEGEPMPETDCVFKITPLFSDGSKLRPEPDTGNTPLTIKLAHGSYAYGNRRVTIAEDQYEIISGVRTQVNKAGDVWLEVLELNGVKLTTPAFIAETHIGKQYAAITQIGTPPPPPPTVEDEPVEVTIKTKSGKVFVANEFNRQ